ncbi:MAG TPA: hypothetical protein VFQ85_13080 [Mycobacteriales bacterium]|jgi:hypothetical protein|nr:hypothetical protein [Mycobacteriales bacterium]
MAAVVVVSRNPALGMGLRHQGHEVTDVRPDRHGDWTRDARIADAVVLELSDAVAAESAVQRLRAEGTGVPVLLVSNSSPGWETTAEHVGPAARVLPLPISLPGLVEALGALLDAGPVTLPPPPANETELLSAVAASIGMTISDSGSLVPHEGPPVVPRVRVPDDLLPLPQPEPEPEPEPEAEPQPAPGPEPERDVMELVAALTERAHELTGVAGCAAQAVDALAGRTAADAAALLLPEGGCWRVAAGHGLRPPEESADVDGDHWLVTDVLAGGEPVALDGAVAPAARERVLAVPVPGANALLVAGRDGAAFGAEELRAAAAVAAETAPVLREAVAVRALARALAPYST